MKVTSRFTGLSLGAALLCASMCANPACAQPPSTAPLPQTEPIPALQDGAIDIAVTQTADGPLMTLQAKSVGVAPLLQEIARKCGLKIIISDDVAADQTKFTIPKVEKLVPDALIKSIVKLRKLASGKVGKDTYLIVKGDTMAIDVKIGNLRGTLIPRDDTPAKPQAPEAPEEKKIHLKWGAPFDFNGSQYYVVPAQAITTSKLVPAKK